MFGSDMTSRQTIKHIPHRIQVTRRELDQFRRLNPDEALVREKAENIRATHTELREFPPDEVVLIHTKVEHLRSVERVLGTGTSIIDVVGIFMIPRESQFFTITKAVRESRPEIAQELVDRFIDPDYNVTSQVEKPEDKKVIVSDAQGAKVSEILKRFKVPDGIATDAEQLYERGADGTVLISLVTHLATRYWTGNENAVNADAFEFA